MAFVVRVVEDDREIKNVHPTHVECKYLVAERDGKKLFQLNTYGSSDREFPDKLSQTLQFGEDSAKELLRILKKEFGE